MRLIDADSLMKKFDPNDVKLLDTIAVRYRIATEETVQPQKIGKWIPVSSYEAFGGDEITWSINGNPIAYHYCSECKAQTRVNEFGEEILSKYCPDCGARMLKEGE